MPKENEKGGLIVNNRYGIRHFFCDGYYRWIEKEGDLSDWLPLGYDEPFFDEGDYLVAPEDLL